MNAQSEVFVSARAVLRCFCPRPCCDTCVIPVSVMSGVVSYELVRGEAHVSRLPEDESWIESVRDSQTSLRPEAPPHWRTFMHIAQCVSGTLCGTVIDRGRRRRALGKTPTIFIYLTCRRAVALAGFFADTS